MPIGIDPTGGAGSGDTTVTIGSVSVSDYNAKFVDQPLQYNDYQVRNRYFYDGHIYTGALTSPSPFNGASVAMFQLAAPTFIWVCDWTSSTFQSQPQVPDPFTMSSSLWVLMDTHVETAQVVLAPDGETPLYRITGTYYFSCTSPSSSIFDQVRFGRPAWVQDVFDRTMPLSKLQPNLGDGTGTGSGSSSSSSTGGGGIAVLGPTGPGGPPNGGGLFVP